MNGKKKILSGAPSNNRDAFVCAKLKKGEGSRKSCEKKGDIERKKKAYPCGAVRRPSSIVDKHRMAAVNNFYDTLNLPPGIKRASPRRALIFADSLST